jgi:Ca2+/Na+ antiporter
MIKNWLRDLALAVQSRSGITAGLVIWVFVAAFALSTAFVFLCVAAYAWLSQAFGGIYAGLIVAGFFILVALIASIAGAVTRRRARERAILQRAARAHANSSWLLDPKILATAMQAGRAIGWQRIVPLALLGFLAAQWGRDRGQAPADEADPSS